MVGFTVITLLFYVQACQGRWNLSVTGVRTRVVIRNYIDLRDNIVQIVLPSLDIAVHEVFFYDLVVFHFIFCSRYKNL